MSNSCLEIKQKFAELVDLKTIFLVEVAKPTKKIDHNLLKKEIQPEILRIIGELRKIYNSPEATWRNIENIAEKENFAIDPKTILRVDEDNFVVCDQHLLDPKTDMAVLHGVLTHPSNRISGLQVPVDDWNFLGTMKILKNANCKVKRLKLNLSSLRQVIFIPKSLDNLASFCSLSGGLDEIIVESDEVDLLYSSFLHKLISRSKDNKIKKIKFQTIKAGILNLIYHAFERVDSGTLKSVEFSVRRDDSACKEESITRLKAAVRKKGINLKINII